MVTNTPNTVRLILIDPKRNAFGELSGSGYLWRSDSLIDTPEGQVIQVLTDLIEEMQHRYERFKKVSADNLLDFQRKAGLQLPRLVCVVDEYAELLMGTRKKVDREQVGTSFVRIAQMGRAAGIHLVLATQRPSRQVVTGVLKANIPGRVAFAEAEPLKRRALAIFIRSLGLDHPNTLTCKKNLTGLLMAMGRSEAEARTSIEALIRAHGLLQ